MIKGRSALLLLLLVLVWSCPLRSRIGRRFRSLGIGPQRRRWFVELVLVETIRDETLILVMRGKHMNLGILSIRPLALTMACSTKCLNVDFHFVFDKSVTCTLKSLAVDLDKTIMIKRTISLGRLSMSLVVSLSLSLSSLTDPLSCQSNRKQPLIDFTRPISRLDDPSHSLFEGLISQWWHLSRPF